MGIFDKAENEAEDMAQKDPNLAQQADQMGGGQLGQDMQTAQSMVGQQGGYDQNQQGGYQDQGQDQGQGGYGQTSQGGARTSRVAATTRTRKGQGYDQNQQQGGYDQDQNQDDRTMDPRTRAATTRTSRTARTTRPGPEPAGSTSCWRTRAGFRALPALASTCRALALFSGRD